MKYILWALFVGNVAAYAQQSINDLTVKDLKVVNTAKGSKPCPLMTTTQRDAIVSPLNGQCIYNTTTSKLNTYNGSAWKQVSDVVDLATEVSGVLPIANGGTGSSTRNFVDLSSSETIAGTKTFSSAIAGSINGNASTVTTNANLTGHVTSLGNAATLGSFSSSNLLTALTDETGTGTAVFSTSPTLVTPDLGVATATSVNGTTIPSSKTLVVTTDKLSVHASTSSSELAGVISDETGSGALVFGTSPTLVTPTLGAASATSLSLSTQLSVANGGTGSTSLTANNVLLGNGTSALQVVAPGTSGNVLTSNGTTWTSSAATGNADTIIASGSGETKFCSATLSSSNVISRHLGGCFASSSGTTTKTITFTTSFWTNPPNCWCNYENGGSTGSGGCDIVGYTSTTGMSLEDYYSGSRNSGTSQIFCHGN